MEGSHEWYRFLKNEGMPNSENKEFLMVNSEITIERKKIRDGIKEFWEETGRGEEVFEVREGCLSLKEQHANELNDRISREEVEKCAKKDRRLVK